MKEDDNDRARRGVLEYNDRYPMALEVGPWRDVTPKTLSDPMYSLDCGD